MDNTLINKISRKWGFENYKELCSYLDLDSKLIGKLISNEGFEHAVYEYGSSQVIKIPKRNILKLFTSKNDPVSDLKIIKKWISNSNLPTTIIKKKDKKDKLYVIVQEKIDIEYLSPNNLFKYSKELLILFEEVKKLQTKEKKSIDISGAVATKKTFKLYIKSSFNREDKPPIHLSNIVINKDNNRLFLIDYRLTPLTFIRKLLSLNNAYALYGFLEWRYQRFIINQIRRHYLDS